MIKEINQNESNFKQMDKEIAQLYKSNIKLFPHEFLFLMVNSQDRLNIIKEVANVNEIYLDKQRLRFFENQEENIGINIFPLKKDERSNKSPYRLMKTHLDRQLIGKNIKFTGGVRPSRTKHQLTREFRDNIGFELTLKKSGIGEDPKSMFINTSGDLLLDKSTAMNLKHILNKDLDRTSIIKSKAKRRQPFRHFMRVKSKYFLL